MGNNFQAKTEAEREFKKVFETIIKNTSQNKEIIKNTSQNEVKKIIESKQLEFSF